MEYDSKTTCLSTIQILLNAKSSVKTHGSQGALTAKVSQGGTRNRDQIQSDMALEPRGLQAHKNILKIK